MGKRVLVVDDKKEIIKLIEFNLRREGFETVVAVDGEEGLKAFEKHGPDFVILDLMLPKKNGIEVCKTIRAKSRVPILMLTAKKEEMDRVLGLELGADDYMTKPFSVRELVARVRAILRRPEHLEPAKSAKTLKTLVLGDFEVSFDSFEAKHNGIPVELTTREFDILGLLSRGSGRVFSREEMLEQVWGAEKGADLDVRTIDQHMARLRKKMGGEGVRLVTVKNRGYRLKTD